MLVFGTGVARKLGGCVKCWSSALVWLGSLVALVFSIGEARKLAWWLCEMLVV